MNFFAKEEREINGFVQGICVPMTLKSIRVSELNNPQDVKCAIRFLCLSPDESPRYDTFHIQLVAR